MTADFGTQSVAGRTVSEVLTDLVVVVVHLAGVQPGEVVAARRHRLSGERQDCGAPMHDPTQHHRPLRVGSLFSGYGGLDLAR